MKVKGILLLVALLLPVAKLFCAELADDSLNVYKLEQVQIITNKETNPIEYIPCIPTTWNWQEIDDNMLQSVRNISIAAANLFIPDYGSKMSNAIYVRGIGSRNSGQTVGIYLDNMPLLDKSAINFNFLDIQKIEVLRGSQSTLYGRSAMSGVINIYTLSPFQYQGTLLEAGGGNYGYLNFKASHYNLLSENVGFSIGGYYNQGNGYFKNVTTDSPADDWTDFGGRIKLEASLGKSISSVTSVAFENSNSNAFPYYQYNLTPVEEPLIQMNDACDYKQNVISLSQVFDKRFNENWSISSTTSYLNYYDMMHLDQDFTANPIFTLMQSQKRNSLTEEILLHSDIKNSHWNFGVFGFYDWLNTDANVLFKDMGIEQIIESNVTANVPDYVQYNIVDTNFDIPNTFKQQTYGLSLYTQFSYDNLLLNGLTATAGARVDYENATLKYITDANLTQFYSVDYYGQHIDDTIPSGIYFDGNTDKNNLQILPKIALNYNFSENIRLYLSASRGYKSGGYNVQMLSDAAQNDLRATMVDSLKASLYEELSSKGMPEEIINSVILAKIPNFKRIDTAPNAIGNMLWYDPEYCFNYEIGSNMQFFDNNLTAGISLYYMQIENAQLTQFSPNGFGRMLSNAGKVNSAGFEIMLNVRIIDDLSIGIEYGYAHATFANYTDTIEVDGKNTEIDYAGKQVPYAPQNTLAINVAYSHQWTNSFIDKVSANVQYLGAGKIYWNEANSLQQNYYNTLNATLGISVSKFELEFWAKNILNANYNVFYFETLGNDFFQQCKPFHCGLSLKVKI
jgi:outer membrane receptor protein involved in Fe transport